MLSKSELINLLGTIPDIEISKLTGHSLTTICSARKYLSISRYQRSWTNEEISLLGTKSDNDIASIIGTTPYHVRTKRTELDIPRCKKNNTKPNIERIERNKRILSLRNAGLTFRQIADIVHVSHECVRIVLRNRKEQ
jgi:hypothetical protein